MNTRKQIWQKNAAFNAWIMLYLAILSLSLVIAGQFAIVWFIGVVVGNEIAFRLQWQT
jgi:hypothetical protein